MMKEVNEARASIKKKRDELPSKVYKFREEELDRLLKFIISIQGNAAYKVATTGLGDFATSYDHALLELQYQSPHIKLMPAPSSEGKGDKKKPDYERLRVDGVFYADMLCLIHEHLDELLKRQAAPLDEALRALDRLAN